MTDLTLTRLKEVLSYDSNSGQFTRISSSRKETTTRFVGKRAGSMKTKRYIKITVDGKQYQAHRLAWFYCFGVWPSCDIDHKDRDKTNNRIDNLREATGSLNQINQGMPKNNTSGHKGVSWSKSNKQWTASIYKSNKRINLGYFETLEAAIEARLQAAKENYKV